MLIKWEGKDVLIIESTNFSITDDMFKDVYHIDVDFDKDGNKKLATLYVDNWYSKHTHNDLIIKDTITNKIYHLEHGYPKNLIIGVNSHISSCEFVFQKYKDISRKYKIGKILDMN